MKKSLSIFTAIILLAGCSVNPERLVPNYPGATPVKINAPIYLRGDFSLWEAQPEYQLKSDGNALYKTRIKLDALDKAYEFKIADKNWSEGLNCGYMSKALDKELEVGIPAQANCTSVYNYFTFTPYESGLYEISINFKQRNKPLVTVVQVFE